MKTLRLTVDPGDLKSEGSRHAIAQAAEILRGGGTVAFPTETVYGLGANALDGTAVAKIFAAKERPSWDPLIVHIGDAAMLPAVAAEVSAIADRLIEEFWPGPLTLLLPKSEADSGSGDGGLMRVGVRMPAHPVAQALLRAADGAGGGAERESVWTNERHDGSACGRGPGRQDRRDSGRRGDDARGGVDGGGRAGVELRGVSAGGDFAGAAAGGVPVPGVDPRGQDGGGNGGGGRSAGDGHSGITRRRARVILVEGEGEAQKARLGAAVRRGEEAGETVGVMLPDGFQAAVMGRQARVFRWGRWEDAEELAQRLYAGLRWLDGAGATVIVCPLPARGRPGDGLTGSAAEGRRRDRDRSGYCHGRQEEALILGADQNWGWFSPALNRYLIPAL